MSIAAKVVLRCRPGQTGGGACAERVSETSVAEASGGAAWRSARHASRACASGANRTSRGDPSAGGRAATPACSASASGKYELASSVGRPGKEQPWLRKERAERGW